MLIHVVKEGETIVSIANDYGISSKLLLQTNGLVNADDLITGQTIVIVYPKVTYTTQNGDTLESVAAEFQVSIMQLFRNNPFLIERTELLPGELIVIEYNTRVQIETNGFAFPYIAADVLKKTLPSLTYLSIYNYRLSKEGVIMEYYDDMEIIKEAKNYGVIPLMLLTTLSPVGEPDIETIYEILISEEYQDRTLKNILQLLRTKGYYGINLILSYLNAVNQNLYNQFITKVYNGLKREGFLVYVTINPDYYYSQYNMTMDNVDFTEIARHADKISYLNFVWGENDGPPLPVSSVRRIRDFTEHIIQFTEPSKLNIGTLLIGYNWRLPYEPGETIANALTLNSVLILASDINAVIQFDELSQTPYFFYYSYGFDIPVRHVVWFIDARTLEALLKIVDEYDLNGTGIWNVMVFNTQMWLIINSQYEVLKYLNTAFDQN